MELKLSNAVVTIKDKLKFGDICKIKVASGIINDDGVQKKDVKNDQIQDPKMVKEMMGMICKNNVEADFVSMECVIKKIMQDDKEIECTREWIEELDEEDANIILEKVKEMRVKKNL